MEKHIDHAQDVEVYVDVRLVQVARLVLRPHFGVIVGHVGVLEELAGRDAGHRLVAHVLDVDCVALEGVLVKSGFQTSLVDGLFHRVDAERGRGAADVLSELDYSQGHAGDRDDYRQDHQHPVHTPHVHVEHRVSCSNARELFGIAAQWVVSVRLRVLNNKFLCLP